MTGFYKDYSDSSDTHQNSAEASADAAEVSATGAATSASEAATSASESATSASEALVSENNASTSESNASTSASNASTSESNASTSASNASTDADDAEDSATQAAASAVAASNHATTAGQSAISASNSASSILNLTVADGATGSTASYDAATGVLTIPVAADGEDGEDGNVYIGSYNENTGVVGFINSNGANFSTGDLRGADGSDATVTTANVTAAGAAMLTGATFTGDVHIESTLPRLYLTDTNNNSDYSIINTDGKFSIYDDSAGVYRTVIDSSGNVGIGTSSPNYEAHIHEATADADARIQLTNADTGTGTGDGFHIIMNGTTAGKQVNLLNREASPLALWTSNTERMRIDSSGNVGINTGTNSISEKLDVVGNIAVSGTVDGVDVAGLSTTVAGKADLSGATFTGNVAIGIPPSGTQSLTVAGTTNLYGGVTGDLNVTGTVTAPNVDISTTGSVTTNIATGADNNNNTDVKVVNIGTGYGGSSSSGDSTTINMGSQDIFAKNIFNIGNGVTTANGSTINLKGTVNVDGNVNVDGKITGNTEGVVLEHNKSADLEPVLELQNTTASGNGYRGAFISMTGYNTSGTEYTRGVIGMGNSTAQYSMPYMAANITSVSCGIKLSGSSATSYNALTPCNSIGTSLNNGMQCGHPFYKWNTVYATNGNIATSDQTHKRDVEELSEAETRVAIACKGLLRKYRWKDAYEEKGEEARIHFGIMAQDLRDAFSAEGLDASRYAMFCSDTWWEDETGERHEEQELAPEGAVETTQLGVRYDELLAFIIAAI